MNFDSFESSFRENSCTDYFLCCNQPPAINCVNARTKGALVFIVHSGSHSKVQKMYTNGPASLKMFHTHYGGSAKPVQTLDTRLSERTYKALQTFIVGKVMKGNNAAIIVCALNRNK